MPFALPGQSIIGRRGRRTVVGGLGPFTPAALGAALQAWWDAEDAATLTLSGSQVTDWTDKARGAVVSQATAGARPLLNPTTLNGRPGVVFDGSDDFLASPGQVAAISSGGAAGEIWVLAGQADAASVQRTVVGLGSTTQASRSIRRSTTGIATGFVSDGTTGTPVNGASTWTGPRVVRLQVGATTSTLFENGVQTGTTAITPNTNNLALRFGSLPFASTFWLGSINSVLFTEPLSADQATALTDFLKARAGLA